MGLSVALRAGDLTLRWALRAAPARDVHIVYCDQAYQVDHRARVRSGPAILVPLAGVLGGLHGESDDRDG
jgi:hypothetical protein